MEPMIFFYRNCISSWISRLISALVGFWVSLVPCGDIVNKVLLLKATLSCSRCIVDTWMKVPKMENQILNKNSCSLHLGRKTFEYTMALTVDLKISGRRETGESSTCSNLYAFSCFHSLKLDCFQSFWMLCTLDMWSWPCYWNKKFFKGCAMLFMQNESIASRSPCLSF